jgi:hypothetical protein
MAADTPDGTLWSARFLVLEGAPDGAAFVEQLVFDSSRYGGYANYFNRGPTRPKRSGQTLRVDPGRCGLKPGADVQMIGRFVPGSPAPGRKKPVEGESRFLCDAAVAIGGGS